MNFIEANGVSLRYAVEGSGRPIVLIHEMGGTLESWSLLAPLLAVKRRVVRYDTRGAGFSEKIRGVLSVDTMTDDLIALLDGLGITGKVALAGTAVGGAIALHTAARFPDRVVAVVATSPAVRMAATFWLIAEWVRCTESASSVIVIGPRTCSRISSITKLGLRPSIRASV